MTISGLKTDRLNVSTEILYTGSLPSSISLHVLNDESAARVRRDGNLDYLDPRTGILYTSNRERYSEMVRTKIASIGDKEIADLEVRLIFDPGNLLAFKDFEFITRSCLKKQTPGYRVTQEDRDYILTAPDNQRFQLGLIAGVNADEEKFLRKLSPEAFRERIELLAQRPSRGLRTTFVFANNELLIQSRPGLVTSILEEIKPITQ